MRGKITPANTRFWSKVNKTESCWLWTAGVCRGGYGKFGVGNNKTINSHRYAYETEVGPIPDGLLVCHHCDNRLCVRPDHLFLGTHKDNTQDAVSKGRLASGKRSVFHAHPELIRRGEQQKQSKLTTEQVRSILRRRGENQPALAAEFGVSQTLISHIHRRKAWKHITLIDPPTSPPASGVPATNS